MKRFGSYFFAFLLLLLFLEVIIGFPIHLGRKPKETVIDEKSKIISEAEQKMEGVHLVESQKAGGRDWELFAEAAEGYQGKGTWELKKIKVLYYNNEKVDFIVVGQRGEINANNKDMAISGQVITTTSNGYRFESEDIKYIAKDRLLKAPDKIKMLGPGDSKGDGLSLEGVGMDAWIEKKEMKILAHVKAVKNLYEGKSFKISSDNAFFSGSSYLARFAGNVELSLDNYKVHGPEAEFIYKSGTDFLQSIMVMGGAKILGGDKYATSETVVYDPYEDKYTLKGLPRVVQNQDEITGEQIVFLNGGKKVKVENIKAKVENE